MTCPFTPCPSPRLPARRAQTIPMKKQLTHFTRTALLVACYSLAACASGSHRESAPSNLTQRPAKHDQTSERYYNVAKDEWEFEPAG